MFNKYCVLSVSALLIMLAPLTDAQHGEGNDTFSMALTGDSIITRKLSVYDEPAYLDMIDVIRSADVAFTNLEMLFHDYEAYPMAISGGTWMRADPGLAKELVWAGFDLVARANNHAGDYGVLGMRLTSKYVTEAGLVEAGVGNSLAEAREAKFLETTKARVALISVASTFAKHMSAGRSRDDIPARPGLNPLPLSVEIKLPQNVFDVLLSVNQRLGLLTDIDGQPTGYSDKDPNKFTALGIPYVVGDNYALTLTSNKSNVEEIAAVVNNASRMADFTIVTIHAHEGQRRDTPPEFLIQYAHDMIDAGADVFVGHGPHALRGIEIYKGKPIFYSLGDFIFQNETLLRVPADSYAQYQLNDNAHLADWNDARYINDSKGFPALPEIWESVIAVPTFHNRKLSTLKLYPVDLGYGKPRQVRGRPLLANRKLGKKIINDLKVRSAPFGTEINFKNGIGVVRVD